MLRSKYTKGDLIFDLGVEDDDTSSVLDCDIAVAVRRNPLPINARWCDEKSAFDYTDFAVDNHYHNAYFSVDHYAFRGKQYFLLLDDVKDTQAHFSKIGYAKHDAWLKAVNCLKSQADYIRSYFNDLWHYVGLVLSVTKTMTDEHGLVWSADISSEYNSLWGIEWSIYSNGSNCSGINNDEQIKRILPDLLPEGIHLTDEDLQEIIYSLEG